jgi:hypothetical protein
LVALALVSSACPKEQTPDHGDGGQGQPAAGGAGGSAGNHPASGGAGAVADAGRPPDAAVTEAGRPPDAAGGPGGPVGVGELDILFMIDNSASMEQEQASLRANFPAFMHELEALPGGLPSLHIAIVSSNFGAGPSVPADSCPPLGDRGRFLVRPNCGLDPGQGAWLSIDRQGTKNFTGDLATVFSCLANLGIMGCGYEHQLQSVRAALTEVAAPPENRGFLRPEAFLAIILLTDEDDCSADPDSTLFEENRTGEAFSLRCALAGHTCGGLPVPSGPFTAPLASCRPAERPADDAARRSHLINVSQLVDGIRLAKPVHPDRIIVSAIMGWDPDINAQYRIGLVTASAGAGTITNLDLLPACKSANGQATPAIRLKAFTEAFGTSGSWYSICAPDLGPVMTNIGRQVAARMGR